MNQSDFSNLRILVVEDNPLQRRILTKILETLNAAEVRHAADGTQALAILDGFLPDVILTNWQMQPMDGLAFARRVRASEHAPFQTVPMIMLSAEDERTHAPTARDTGINAFIAKPISPDKLRAQVLQVLETPRAFVRSAHYSGPDRRFHDVPFAGPDRRRADSRS